MEALMEIRHPANTRPGFAPQGMYTINQHPAGHAVPQGSVRLGYQNISVAELENIISTLDRHLSEIGPSWLLLK